MSAAGGQYEEIPWPKERELVIDSLSFVFDHDMVDGAPVARFIGRLTELAEGGFGLPEEAQAADIYGL